MNNLYKDFLPYKESSKLKQIGFEEDCLAYYDDEKVLVLSDGNGAYQQDFDNDNSIAPLFYEVFQWFREKHQLHSTSFPLKGGKVAKGCDKREWLIHYLDEPATNGLGFKNMMSCNNQYDDIGYFKTLRDAELNAINVMIKIVEERK